MFLSYLFECIITDNAPCVVWKKSTYSLESLTGNPSVWSKQKKCYVLALNREGRIAALAVNGRTTSSCKLVFINSASEAVSVHSVYRNTKEHIGRFVGCLCTVLLCVEHTRLLLCVHMNVR